MESKSLLSDMQKIFGTSFGGTTLDEGRKSKPMAPGPGDFRGKGDFKQAASQSHSARKAKRSQMRQALQLLKKISGAGGDAGDDGGDDDGDEMPAPKRSEGPAAHRGGGGGGTGAAAQGSSGAKGGHNPFKRSPNLGKGPGTPPGFSGSGPRYHDQDKCWHCSCGNIYKTGCRCVGTGASKDCPAGKVKKIKINYKYRQAYNKQYHKWRGNQGGEVTARVARGQRGA